MASRTLRLMLALLAGAAVGAAAADIPIKNTRGGIDAFIREGGRVEDAFFRTLGYVREGGRVEDMGFRTLGFVNDDGSITDASLRRLGAVRAGGRLEDASFKTVGYIREGVIQDSGLAAVGYYDGRAYEGDADAALAAYVFFFSPVLFAQPEWDTVHKP
jgi:hypothetical protein